MGQPVTGETAGFDARIATRLGFVGSRMSMLALNVVSLRCYVATL
jgi:hypothetical protein